MSQEVIEVTERDIEVVEIVQSGPVGPAGPQANINYTVVSSAQTLSNSQNIAADTSGGSFTLTLPASPNAGDSIDIFDYSETFDTNPLTIARNGENIESLAEDLVCNVEGAYFTLIYTGATRGWQVLPRFGTSGGGGETVLTTEGDMLYRGAGINTRLPIGSAGQILKVNSGATAPEWGAAPATGVTSVGVSGSDGIEVDSGSPVTGSGTIALGVNAATLRSHINVADGANNYTHPNHSGDVTSVGDGATTIANDVVTNAKLANVATSTIKGRATAGTGDPEDLTATQVRTILNVADGAEVNVQSNWTEADSGSDAFILNKPSTFTPSTHASTHATGGTDAIAPSDIGAQSLFDAVNVTEGTETSPHQLSALRAQRVRVATTNDFTIRLPESGHQSGDIVEIFAATLTATKTITIERGVGSTAWATLATITTQNAKIRILANGTGRSNWQEDSYFTTNGTLGAPAVHVHAAADITSGTLAHERGGLEADVSAYNGLVKISGGSTSAVTVTSAGEALLDDADAAAQRTTLGLGNSATLDTGTTAGTVAAGDHTHELNSLDATGATDGHVLTADGAGGAAFEAIPSTALNDLSNVSAAAPSDNDVLVYDNATSTWVAEAPAALPIEFVIACSDETSDLTTGTAKVTFRAPVAFLLTGVAASVNTAPTGSTLIVDINNGANSALSTKLSIDASEKTSATAAFAAVIDTNYDDFAADAEITIDIDQVGSTVAGKGLKVVLKGTRA